MDRVSTSLLSLFLLSWIHSAISTAADNATCTSCNSHSPEELRKLRLEQLRNSILAQMGYTEVPEAPVPPPTKDDIDAGILDDYEDLTSNAATAEAKCNSGDFFAKPINSFLGFLSPVEGMQNQE
jgi:hypothetical protein